MLPASRLSQRGDPSQSSFTDLQQRIAPRTSQGEQAWNYDGAYLYWLQQRAYPKNEINWDAYSRAFSQRSRMSSARFAPREFAANQSALPAEPRWDFLGPSQLPIPYQIYYGEGLVSGRVNSVAFDPNNSNVLYLAAAGGGFWKSVDGGKKWTCLSDRWENVKFSSVAVHPTNSNIIIVGTGDFQGGMGYGYGLMMTTDGVHWTNVLRNELRWYSVSQILFDPDDPNIITVTAGRHPQNKGIVFRSANGGKSWSRVLTAAGSNIDWSNVQVSAKTDTGQRYYYAIGVLSGNGFRTRTIRRESGSCTAGEIWRSTNRGLNWTKLSGRDAGTCIEGMDVAPSSSAPKTVYLVSLDYFTRPGHVWVSPDAGDSWNDITNDFPNHLDVEKQDFYNWSQAYYDLYIRTARHPITGKDVIYVGLIDIVASLDEGATWVSVGKTYTSGARTHNDQHALAVNPRNPNDLLLGNDGGVYRVTFDPAQRSWSFQNDMNGGLGMTMFYRIAINPTNPDWIMGGAQDNATPVSMGDLETWSNKGEGDGGFCAINPRDTQTQYATSQNLKILRTTNAWKDSYPITPFEPVTNSAGETVNVSWGTDRRGFIAPIALNPNNPNQLYAGTNYLWRWEETKGWDKRLGNQSLAAGDGYINFIAIAPSDSNRIYTGSSLGDLWMTADGGSTWQRIDNDRLPGATPALPVTSIAVHPTNPDRIVVGFGSTERFAHVWRCDNTRAAEIQWTPLGGTGATSLPFIPLNAVVIDSRHPDTTYYVGTDVGVFLSNDAGITWANFGAPNGLPNVQVTDLQLVPGKRQLVAATFGRGAWRIDLPEGATPVYLKPRAKLDQHLNRLTTPAKRFEVSPKSQTVFDQVKARLLILAGRQARQQTNSYVWPPAVELGGSSGFDAYASRFREQPDGTFEAPMQDQKFVPRILITQGAMSDLIEDDPDRLAFVMGHEIAHVMLGHVLPTSSSERTTVKTLRMVFTAEQEHEADVLGMKLALAADYSIRGAREIWVRINSNEFLQKHPGFNYTSFEGVSSTHPAWSDRLQLIDTEKASLWKAMSAFENGVYLLTFQNYPEAEVAFNRVLDSTGCDRVVGGKQNCQGFPESYDAQANLGYALLMQYLDRLDSADIAQFNIGQVVTGSFYTRPESLRPQAKGIDSALWNKAVGALRTALDLNPHAEIARANLGVAYLFAPNGKNVIAAVNHLVVAADASRADQTITQKNRAAILINCAVALIAANDFDKAGAKLDEAEQLLTDDDSFAALNYNRALLNVRSSDPAQRNKSITQLNDYLRRESPASLWWPLAYILYARLSTAAGQIPTPEAALKQVWRDEAELRPVTAVEFEPGKFITLSDLVTSVYEKLGSVGPIPTVRETPLVRLVYSQRGLEFLVTRRVIAILLHGTKAPPIKLQRKGPGAPFATLRIGMSVQEVTELLKSQAIPVQLTSERVSYDFYPSAGVAIRYDSNDKVVELAITRPAIEW